ncbi:MAG: phosphoribosyltransferase [Leptospirales bacterium]
MTQERFKDRTEAGQALSRAFLERGEPFDFILALARGGVPVGAPISRALKIPLFPMVVRKIGVPGQKELALGALSEGGSLLWNTELIENRGIHENDLSLLREKARKEINDRVSRLRSGLPLPAMENRRVLLVDDGAATGATLLAAAREVLRHHPDRIMAGLPVAPYEFSQTLKREGIPALILLLPRSFQSVGEWYDQFPEVSDGEVLLIQSSMKNPEQE